MSGAALELPFQSKLIQAVKEEGGWGRKLSNRFIIGMPDLLLKLPCYVSPFLVEVKMVVLPVRLDDQLKVALTALQGQTLLEWRRAGGSGGALICYQEPGRGGGKQILAYRTHETPPTKQEFLNQCMIQPFRKPLAPLMASILAPLLCPSSYES